MPSEKDNTSEFKHYMKSDKIPYIIYADIESLIKKIDGCASKPENSSTTTIGEHIHIFHVDVQCQQFGHLITQKTNILYITEKIV